MTDFTRFSAEECGCSWKLDQEPYPKEHLHIWNRVYKDFKGLHPRLSSKTAFVQRGLSLEAPLNSAGGKASTLWGAADLVPASCRDHVPGGHLCPALVTHSTAPNCLQGRKSLQERDSVCAAPHLNCSNRWGRLETCFYIITYMY